MGLGFLEANQVLDAEELAKRTVAAAGMPTGDTQKFLQSTRPSGGLVAGSVIYLVVMPALVLAVIIVLFRCLISAFAARQEGDKK